MMAVMMESGGKLPVKGAVESRHREKLRHSETFAFQTSYLSMFTG